MSLFVFVLFLANNGLFAQLQPSSITVNSKISKDLLRDGKRIMKKLKFPVRENLNKDGIVSFYIDSEMQDIQAAYQYHTKDRVSTSVSNTYYKNSWIALSPLLNDILLGIKDTSKNTILLCKSVLIHEMVHYLQWSNSAISFIPDLSADSEELNRQMRIYLNQPHEFEAFAVCAYYFIEKYDKKALKQIMSTKASIKRKYELLINKYRYIDNPLDPLIFSP